ncbi:hypothetical protein NVP1101O_054 [Vibrio phage 1.101.O._10N.261.45.C6]|nr:hypothetical protein NVP1101O_054 [Vibrio phage 1.101.O._10N.261.45.C6]
MKVRFFCDSGANIHSCREEVIDLEEDLGISDEEWNSMGEEDQQKEVMEWAWDRLDVGWEEI